MKKTFFVAQIRNLLNQVHNEKITFSRFVEILNEEVERQRKFNISKFDENTDWFGWLSKDEQNGLNEISTQQAIRDISKRLNEISDALNAL